MYAKGNVHSSYSPSHHHHSPWKKVEDSSTAEKENTQRDPGYMVVAHACRWRAASHVFIHLATFLARQEGRYHPMPRRMITNGVPWRKGPSPSSWRRSCSGGLRLHRALETGTVQEHCLNFFRQQPRTIPALLDPQKYRTYQSSDHKDGEQQR